jgi:hypothetical protein
MRWISSLAVLMLFAYVVAGCANAETPHRDVRTDDWMMIEPGGDTRCALDTPYAFWVREGDPNRLLVFFQGGGACWDAASCRPESGLYKSSIWQSDNPAGQRGILDTTDPRNPFAGYTMVHVPYCTGDLHWGDKVVSYSTPEGDPNIVHHRGFVNAAAALAWVEEHVPAPKRVLVAGCSAGSIGSILHAPYLIRRYPNARVAQVGDSLALPNDRPVDIEALYGAAANLPRWSVELQALDARRFTSTAFYIAVANTHPNATFMEFHFEHDPTQERYHYLRNEGEFRAARDRHLREIMEATDNYTAVVANDRGHCVLPTAAFPTYEVEGQLLAQRIAALLER